MNIPLIDNNRIKTMMEQMKAAAAQPTSGGLSMGRMEGVAKNKIDFADALKNSIDQVSNSQNIAEKLGERFAMGDDSVNLSDVMIATQKAGISFQAAVQVRNKLVTAYHDIISMQI